MKLNEELVRQILLKAEGDSSVDLSVYDSDKVMRHEVELYQFGLVDGMTLPPGRQGERFLTFVDISCLTKAGFAYLDQVRLDGAHPELKVKVQGLDRFTGFPE